MVDICIYLELRHLLCYNSKTVGNYGENPLTTACGECTLPRNIYSERKKTYVISYNYRNV